METQIVSKHVEYEQKLIGIIRRLPPERVSQVIDFAQFLEFQITKAHEGILYDVNEEEIAAENAQWDALLATDELTGQITFALVETSLKEMMSMESEDKLATIWIQIKTQL